MRKVKRWHKLIPGVDVKYGAPMGRRSVGKFPKDGTVVFDIKVPMCECCGAYDLGGVYWGIGKELRVKYTEDLAYIEFYRLQPKMWYLHNQDKIDYFTVVNPDEFIGITEVDNAKMASDLVAGGTTIDEKAQTYFNTYFN